MSSIAAGLALFVSFTSLANAGASGSGVTTRYWDCCKPSCAWPGKADVSNPVGTCDATNTPLTGPNAANTASGCNGGSAYMCSTQQPWNVSDTLAYGFAAVNIAGGSEASWCCACYALTFTSTSLASSGKTFVVQATNTGGDLGSNQFDLALPGGGLGIFDGCTTEWNTPSGIWGAQYGGVSSLADCSNLPGPLQSGCQFRFGWFEGADNPTVTFEQVACPTELTDITGCTRADDNTEPSFHSPSENSPSSASAGSSSPVASASTHVSTASSVSLGHTTAASYSTTLSTVVAQVSNCGGNSGAVLQSHWGQCGGSLYSGPTSCSAPYACQTQNPWYAQCL